MIIAFTRKSGHNALQKRSLTAIQQISAIPNLRNYSNVHNGGFNSGNISNISSIILLSHWLVMSYALLSPVYFNCGC